MKKRTFKPFTFKGTVTWTGGRTWDFAGEDSPIHHGAPPAKLRGEAGKLSPEDLMLASVHTCLISTLTHYTTRDEFDFVSFNCETEGTIEHTEDDGYRYTKMVQKVRMGVKSEDDILIAQDLINKAHDSCWMGNSIKAEITVESDIFIES